MAKKAKTPAAGKTAAGRNKQTGKGSASSGRAAKPAKRIKSEDGKKKHLVEKLISLLKKRVREKQKLRPKNEFRYNHDTKHMNFVFGETEEEFKSVGLTSHDTTFGRKNMPLKKNPKKGNENVKTDKSYIRNGIISDRKGSYSKKTAKNCEFSAEDKPNVKSKIRHYKKEQKKKK